MNGRLAPGRDGRLRHARVFVRSLLGIPAVAIATMIAVTIANRGALPASGASVSLSVESGGHATALVFGAGSGIHLVRLDASARTLTADLSAHPLRVVALQAIQLRATNVGDPQVVQLSATGPMVQLRRLGTRVLVSAGF